MKIGTILAVAALAVAGCGKKDEGTPAQSDAKPAPAPAPAAAAQKKSAPVDMKAVAVEVNGKKLTFGEMDADASKAIVAQKVPAEQVEDARKFFYEQLAQQFVMKTIFLDEAKKKGVKLLDEDRKKAEAEMAKANAARTLVPMIVKMGFEEPNITISFRKDFSPRNLQQLLDQSIFENEKKKYQKVP